MAQRAKIFRPAFLKPRKQQQQDYDRFRGTSASRGYGRAWQKVRNLFLKAHPLCNRCSSDDMPVIATLVHHMVPVEIAPDRILDWHNLEQLCDSCHQKEHAA